MRRIISLFIFIFCVTLQEARAQELPNLETQVQQLTRIVNELKLTVEKQQREISSLKIVQENSVASKTFESAKPQMASSAGSLQGRWNPDIGAIADVVLALDSPKEDAEGADRISVRELELVFGSAVDPYSRFDATLAISDFEEMEIEEAYLTHFGLPWGLKGRLGRFLPKIGKAISVHRDSLDTVDEPLVIQRYFGHHGFNKTGADLSRIVDIPWPVTHEISVGILEGGNGEEGSLFGDSRRRPTFYTHLKNYINWSDELGSELGISHLAGSRDEDVEFEVNVIGLDGTLIYRYADQRHFKIQGESFLVDRSGSFIETTDDSTGDVFFDDVDDNRHLWGSYFITDLRFHPQWAAGFRFDHVQLVDADAANLRNFDRGYTGYVTFYQSEFARWRMQWTHLDLSSGEEDNQIFIQGTFAIGEHKHKLQ